MARTECTKKKRKKENSEMKNPIFYGFRINNLFPVTFRIQQFGQLHRCIRRRGGTRCTEGNIKPLK